MKLIVKTWAHGFDFVAIYECEHCRAKYSARGYDDSNFYQNIIPNAVCEKCGKKTDSTTSRQERLSGCEPIGSCPTCGQHLEEGWPENVK